MPTRAPAAELLARPANDLTESGLIHMVEHDVRRRLLAREDMTFPSLVVRRVGGGLLLEGVLESDLDDPAVEVEAFVREVTGIENVRSHLVCRCRHPWPAKG